MGELDGGRCLVDLAYRVIMSMPDKKKGQPLSPSRLVTSIVQPCLGWRSSYVPMCSVGLKVLENLTELGQGMPAQLSRKVVSSLCATRGVVAVGCWDAMNFKTNFLFRG